MKFNLQKCSLLLKVHALQYYLEHKAAIHSSQQFIHHGVKTWAAPLSEQRLARWMMDLSIAAYDQA